MWYRAPVVWDALEKHPDRLRRLVYHTTSRILQSMKTKKPSLEVDYSLCPIVMLWGERDGEEHILAEGGGSTHINIARQLYEQIRHVNSSARFLTLDGGHTILYDRPSYVIGEMNNILGVAAQKINP